MSPTTKRGAKGSKAQSEELEKPHVDADKNDDVAADVPDTVEDDSEDEDDEEEEEEEEDSFDSDDIYEVESIVDVSCKRKQLIYLVSWIDATEKTWITEDSFAGIEAIRMRETFKDNNRKKVDELLEKIQRRARKKSQKPWVVVSEPDPNENPLAPRELTEDDEFYGHRVSALPNETRKLVDLTHRQTEKDMLLAALGVTGQRTSRSQFAKMMQSSDNPLAARTPDRSASPAQTSEETSRDKDKEPPAVAAKKSASPKEKATSDETAAKKRGRPPKKRDSDELQSPPKGQKKATSKIRVQDENDDDDVEQDFDSKQGPPSLPSSREDSRDSTDVTVDRSRVDEQTAGMGDQADGGGRKQKATTSTSKDGVKKYGNSSGSTRKRVVVARDSDGDLPVGRATSLQGEQILPLGSDDVQVPWGRRMTLNRSRDAVDDPVDKALREFGEFNRKMDIKRVVDLVRLGNCVELQKALATRSDVELSEWATWRSAADKKTILHVAISQFDGKSTKAKECAAPLLVRYLHQSALRLQDALDNIPLHDAVTKQMIDVIRFLVRAGSPIDVRNARGLTPLDVAVALDNKEIVPFLLENGAQFHNYLIRPKLNGVSKEVMDAIFAAHNSIAKELKSARADFYGPGVRELAAVTPPMMFPRHDSNEFGAEFLFEFVPSDLDGDYAHLMFLIPMAFHRVQRRWHARRRDGLDLSMAPRLNGVRLQHAQFCTMPMAFFVIPQNGNNVFNVDLTADTWNRSSALAVQIVRYRVDDPVVL